MKRGEIWWCNFDPAVGSEVKKMRPAVIVSNDASNQNVSRVQVLPCTTGKIEKVYPCETFLIVDGKGAKAMADQIRTVSKSRLQKKIRPVSDEEMDEINEVLKVQLGLEE